METKAKNVAKEFQKRGLTSVDKMLQAGITDEVSQCSSTCTNSCCRYLYVYSESNGYELVRMLSACPAQLSSIIIIY